MTLTLGNVLYESFRHNHTLICHRIAMSSVTLKTVTTAFYNNNRLTNNFLVILNNHHDATLLYRNETVLLILKVIVHDNTTLKVTKKVMRRHPLATANHRHRTRGGHRTRNSWASGLLRVRSPCLSARYCSTSRIFLQQHEAVADAIAPPPAADAPTTVDTRRRRKVKSIACVAYFYNFFLPSSSFLSSSRSTSSSTKDSTSSEVPSSMISPSANISPYA